MAQSIWQLFSVYMSAMFRIRSALKRNNTLTGESLTCPNIGKTWAFQWHISRLSLRVSNGEHAISFMMNWSISDIASCRSRQRHAWVEFSFFFIICLVKFITNVWYRCFTDKDIVCHKVHYNEGIEFQTKMYIPLGERPNNVKTS